MHHPSIAVSQQPTTAWAQKLQEWKVKRIEYVQVKGSWLSKNGYQDSSVKGIPFTPPSVDPIPCELEHAHC
jgi:hypothetical protein